MEIGSFFTYMQFLKIDNFIPGYNIDGHRSSHRYFMVIILQNVLITGSTMVFLL